ncbi:hypothetical protein M0804_000722 [Polistes exclamans]|nr:hypothetical protein M0804_000722 [Polistes exclamans]
MNRCGVRVIWYPYTKFHNYDIEKDQHEFLRLAAAHSFELMSFTYYDYDDILKYMNMSTLNIIRLFSMFHLEISGTMTYYILKLIILPMVTITELTLCPNLFKSNRDAQ